jgi:hypothetical protein
MTAQVMMSGDGDEEEEDVEGEGDVEVNEGKRLLGQGGSDKLEKRNTRRRKQA